MVEGVFCDCEALTSIEIPASVEMIDMYYCINLANIYCYPSIPPILNDFRCKNFVLYLEPHNNQKQSEISKRKSLITNTFYKLTLFGCFLSLPKFPHIFDTYF